MCFTNWNILNILSVTEEATTENVIGKCSYGMDNSGVHGAEITPV